MRGKDRLADSNNETWFLPDSVPGRSLPAHY